MAKGCISPLFIRQIQHKNINNCKPMLYITLFFKVDSPPPATSTKCILLYITFLFKVDTPHGIELVLSLMLYATQNF